MQNRMQNQTAARWTTALASELKIGFKTREVLQVLALFAFITWTPTFEGLEMV